MTCQRAPRSGDVDFLNANQVNSLSKYRDNKDRVSSGIACSEDALSEKRSSTVPVDYRRGKEPISDPFDEMAIIEDIDTVEDVEGPTITFRAVVVGLFAGALGAAISQVCG